MLARERVRAAIRGQPTDRPALAYLFLGGARHVLAKTGDRLGSAYRDARAIAANQAAAAELFGHDSGMVPWGCLTIEAEAFGCRIEVLDDYYPRVVQRPLEEAPDLSRLCDPDPACSGRMPLVLDALGQLRERCGDDLFVSAMVVSPFLVAAELRGMSSLLMDFIRDPAFVEALFESVTAGTERYLRAVLRAAACDAVLFENAGACRELIGPHHVAQYVMPFQRRLLAAARDEAPDVILIEHNCSDTPYFDEILGLDVDAVSFAHGDVRAIHAEHGWDCHAKHTTPNACLERFCLAPRGTGRPRAWIGNVDHSRVLLNGSPEQVYREARACIESARSAPFVLSTGCEIPFKAPLENIQALARAAQDGF
ncbi:MAG TPA: uroporphyrinogen decarboxylase family protein [Myxococcota bacterium]